MPRTKAVPWWSSVAKSAAAAVAAAEILQDLKGKVSQMTDLGGDWWLHFVEEKKEKKKVLLCSI